MLVDVFFGVGVGIVSRCFKFVAVYVPLVTCEKGRLWRPAFDVAGSC